MLGWKRRATVLNARPLPGRFDFYPDEITEDAELEDNILNAMCLDWEKVVKALKSAITRSPRNELCGMEYNFGKERVKVVSQSYRCVYMNLLTRLSLFGPNYRKLLDSEVVYSTKKVLLVHISSKKRMEELFTVADMCGVKFKHKSGLKWHTCSGKVNTKKHGWNRVGYILEERYGKWMVQLLGDREPVKMKVLDYDREEGKYIYDGHRTTDGQEITEYWPIRFLINISGESKFTLNRVTFNLANIR